MNPYFDMKVVPVISPQEIDDSATTGYFDTNGFQYAILDVVLGPVGSGEDLLEFKIQEAESVSDGYLAAGTKADILVGGAAEGQGVDFVWPDVGDGVSTDQIVRVHFKIPGKRKRFIGISLKTTEARNVCAVATLCESLKDLPTAGEQGVDLMLEV